jgi:hypothetical protein
VVEVSSFVLVLPFELGIESLPDDGAGLPRLLLLLNLPLLDEIFYLVPLPHVQLLDLGEECLFFLLEDAERSFPNHWTIRSKGILLDLSDFVDDFLLDGYLLGEVSDSHVDACILSLQLLQL